MLPIYRYRSRRTFRADRRGGGVNSDYTYTVRTAAVGKGKWEESPYLLANEWIAGNLAQYLRLPVPPFAIVSKRSRGTRMFISYDYEGDTTPDDVKPRELYSRFASECTGVVMLDILVANCDRHGGNLKVDKPDAPNVFYVIDHERALFYIYKGDGLKRLHSRNNRLGINDGSQSKDEFHCLIGQLDSAALVVEWVNRIRDIPKWFIDEVCEEACNLGITRAECEGVKAFLKDRQVTISSLILNNKSRFPLVPTADWPSLIF